MVKSLGSAAFQPDFVSWITVVTPWPSHLKPLIVLRRNVLLPVLETKPYSLIRSSLGFCKQVKQ